MILFVTFAVPVVAEPWPGGTTTWSLRDMKDSRVPSEVVKESGGITVTWEAMSGRHAGKVMRLRVPMSNVVSVLEVEDDVEKPKK